MRLARNSGRFIHATKSVLCWFDSMKSGVTSKCISMATEWKSKLTCNRSDTRIWLRHSHQKTKTFLGVTLTVSDIAGDITDRGNAQWTDSTGCQPSVPVIHSFMGVSLDSVNMRHAMLLRLYPTWHVLALLEIMQLLVEVTRLRSWGS